MCLTQAVANRSSAQSPADINPLRKIAPKDEAIAKKPYDMSMLTTSKSASCGVTQILSSSGSEASMGDTNTFPTQKCRNPKVIANCQVFSIRKTVPITPLMELFPADRVTSYGRLVWTALIQLA
ncbi:unnamed protein product [Ceratitis capitata]|uniref:(Mediterranean fruit fly) hypothetical protein n=1 Tax=Ceratitis capitata TaxID=7213 RepID=A0A811UQH4_CERCA|nr:unnamed protein product [Ceratitis capitata]